MRLFAISMVRNEADVIEAFVRHSLRELDGMVVVDHASMDDTSAILGKLQSEGLPLRVVSDTRPEFFQAERMTTLAREVLERERADFVLPLDADEFVRIESRERLEAALAELPKQAHGIARSLNYVPASFDERPVEAGHLRWRVDDSHEGKVIVSRAFLAHARQYIISGNHLVDDAAAARPPIHVRMRRDEISLAHLPVRSARQLVCKVVIGHAAHLATRPANDGQAFHWRDLYADLMSGREFSAAALREIACNYGLPRSAWRSLDSIELVDDPVPVQFGLRYATYASADPLRLLMRFVEDLIRQTAQTR